jgi:1,4-alpha-glucan branching enzyme
MLYLDYSRRAGEWLPNEYGGNENLEAIHFLQRLNEVVHREYPGALMIAEESTAWPQVSRPVYLGGLGFDFKWNMGWMHDMLQYMAKDPVHRKYHHNLITFGLLYAFYENFILVLSHDEVVHGKRALLDKMPGDRWQKFANLRLLYAFMYGHPGKKHLFMGGEFGQWGEWYEQTSLDWHLLDQAEAEASALHRGLQQLIRDLNHLYRAEPSLYEVDTRPEGFEWIDFNDTDNVTVSFLRRARDPSDFLVFVANMTPVPRSPYRIGVPEPPRAGRDARLYYREVLNTDATDYGGSGLGNLGAVEAEPVPWHGRPCSLNLTLPPLAVVVLKPVRRA